MGSLSTALITSGERRPAAATGLPMGAALNRSRPVGRRHEYDRTRRAAHDGIRDLAPRAATTIAHDDQRGLSTCCAEYETPRIAEVDHPLVRVPGS